jgi:ribosomal protein S18 acetylase RimI-like enzyme
MDGYMIRPVTAQDQAFLQDMLYASIHTPAGEQPPERDIIFQPFLSKYVEEWGRNGDAGFIAVDSAGQPVGSVTYRFFKQNNKGYGFVDEQTPELSMAILEPFRGRGIGTSLLRAIVEEAGESGLKALSLSVDPSNPAMRLYQRFGFKEIGIDGTSITMKADLSG